MIQYTNSMAGRAGRRLALQIDETDPETSLAVFRRTVSSQRFLHQAHRQSIHLLLARRHLPLPLRPPNAAAAPQQRLQVFRQGVGAVRMKNSESYTVVSPSVSQNRQSVPTATRFRLVVREGQAGRAQVQQMKRRVRTVFLGEIGDTLQHGTGAASWHTGLGFRIPGLRCGVCEGHGVGYGVIGFRNRCLLSSPRGV